MGIRFSVLALLGAALLNGQQGQWKAGVARAEITPFLDQPLAGYFYPRSAEGVHDSLYAKVLAIELGAKAILIVTCDLEYVPRGVVTEARAMIGKALSIQPENILIAATHSHTGPEVGGEYARWLSRKIADTAISAFRTRVAATLSTAEAPQDGLAHYRRYVMKDGGVVTNPGFLNPAIVRSAGEVDRRLNALVSHNGRGEVIFSWVHYALHLDTVGGAWISADFPNYIARELARSQGPDALTFFTMGAAGNINHWDVKRPGPQRGHEEARRIGETLGRSALRALQQARTVPPNRLAAHSEVLRLRPRTATAAEAAEAEKILAVPPPRDVDFTLDRVKAERVRWIRENADRAIEAELQVLAIGDLAVVAVPGELFTELGSLIRKGSPFAQTLIVTQANGSIGYMPTRAAYTEGGYEPATTRLEAGEGERFVEAASGALKRLAGKLP